MCNLSNCCCLQCSASWPNISCRILPWCIWQFPPSFCLLIWQSYNIPQHNLSSLHRQWLLNAQLKLSMRICRKTQTFTWKREWHCLHVGQHTNLPTIGDQFWIYEKYNIDMDHLNTYLSPLMLLDFVLDFFFLQYVCCLTGYSYYLIVKIIFYNTKLHVTPLCTIWTRYFNIKSSV